MQLRGFTLIEILVVLGIVAVLASATTSAFSRYTKAQLIESETARVVALFADAQARALAARDNEPHGIHLATSTVVLFKGSTYTPGANENYELGLHPQVNITDISLASGGSDIVFKRISGATEESGSIEISLLDGSRSKTITIDRSGIAYVEE